jgi:hypothetical protein
MKVKLWVSTGFVGSKIEQVLEFDDFEEDDFNEWLWNHIDAGFEIVEDE